MAFTGPAQIDAAYAQEVLAACAQRTGVAGAQLSVVTPGGRVDVAYGVADASTSRPMTAASRSQAGSFAKVLTAVLVHRLVDSGDLTLTARVADVAAEHGQRWSTLGDVRVGQLLAMTSGLDWGVWAAGATVAEALSPQLGLAPRSLPGSSFGYTFAATMVAARLVELVRRSPWTRCVARDVVDPLGLELTVTGTDAVCPVHTPNGGGWSATPPPPALAGMGPTGTTLASSAADLATVAGAIAACSPLLMPSSRTALHQGVVPVGAHMVADAWCHGPYSRAIGGGRRLHGHGGRWAAGVSDVTWEAATGTGVAIVTNTPSRGGALVLAVSREIHRRLWGDDAVVDPVPSDPGVELDTLTGTFVTATRRYDVQRRGERLVVRATAVHHPAAVFGLPDSIVELGPVGERRFLPVREGVAERRLQELWFSAGDLPAYLYDGFVGARRVSSTTADSAAGSWANRPRKSPSTRSLSPDSTPGPALPP